MINKIYCIYKCILESCFADNKKTNNTIEKNLIKKKSLNELKLKLVKHKRVLVTSEETHIQYDLSITLVDKLIHIIDELLNTKNDLHKLASTTRYILETLIITKLLLKEENYFVKIYFTIYNQQENKVNLIIQRLKYEIEILKKYAEEYSVQTTQNRSKYSTQSNDDEQRLQATKKIMEENEKIFQQLRKEALKDITIFMNQLNNYGFDALSIMLEKDTLQEYENKLKEIQSLKSEKAKQLSKEQWFKSYFGTSVQHTQIFQKMLKDTRSWQEKAEAVGLKEEYKLNYEMTSAFLHFTSYSLLTPNIASQDEIDYMYRLINQYIEQITTNISIFSRVNLYDKLNIMYV